MCDGVSAGAMSANQPINRLAAKYHRSSTASHGSRGPMILLIVNEHHFTLRASESSLYIIVR
jgi:hypothetical protein